MYPYNSVYTRVDTAPGPGRRDRWPLTPAQEEAQEETQGLLGERLLKTPEASSMVFLLAVSLATL